MNQLLSTLLAFVVSIPLMATSVQAEDIKGDARSGQTKNAMCIGCHGIVGYKASFPEVYQVPMISGQSEKYIVSSLSAYKKGERKHPTMRGIAEGLSEQDMADLAAYYSGRGAIEKAAEKPSALPSKKVAAMLNKANCQSCHGANFSTPVIPDAPKIAGQHADYLFVALKAYKVEESNQKVGRNNPIMGAMAKQFSNAELKDLADYLASLDGQLKVEPESRFRR